MLDFVIANDIRNALQSERHHIEWFRFNHCNAYTTMGALVNVTIGNDEYFVLPIMSYETVVGFVYERVVYEIGKYSQTTSKQMTQICKAYFSDYDRIFMKKGIADTVLCRVSGVNSKNY